MIHGGTAGVDQRFSKIVDSIVLICTSIASPVDRRTVHRREKQWMLMPNKSVSTEKYNNEKARKS